MSTIGLVIVQALFGIFAGLGFRGFLGSVTENNGFVLSGAIGAVALPVLVNLKSIVGLLF